MNRGIDFEIAMKRQENPQDEETMMDEVYDYLTDGTSPEGVECESPNLSPKMASSVIWFLQEVARVLPDNWEICSQCECLYNEDAGGAWVDEDEYKLNDYEPEDKYKNFCGDCRPYERETEGGGE